MLAFVWLWWQKWKFEKTLNAHAMLAAMKLRKLPATSPTRVRLSECVSENTHASIMRGHAGQPRGGPGANSFCLQRQLHVQHSRDNMSHNAAAAP